MVFSGKVSRQGCFDSIIYHYISWELEIFKFYILIQMVTKIFALPTPPHSLPTLPYPLLTLPCPAIAPYY